MTKYSLNFYCKIIFKVINNIILIISMEMTLTRKYFYLPYKLMKLLTHQMKYLQHIFIVDRF